MKRKRGNQGLPVEQLDIIEDAFFLDRDVLARDVLAQLDAQSTAAPAGTFTVPKLNTVQARLRQLARAHPLSDPGDVWSVQAAPAHEVPAVVPVLAALAERSNGARWTVTREEGRLIHRVALAAPDLGPFWRWHLASKYLRRSAGGKPTDSLDMLLSARPWADRAALARFVGIVGTRARRGRLSVELYGVVLDAARITAEREGGSVDAVLADIGITATGAIDQEGAPDAPGVDSGGDSGKGGQ